MKSDDRLFRLLPRQPSIVHTLSDIELPAPPSLKPNEIFSEQLEFLKSLSRENNAAASLAVREDHRSIPNPAVKTAPLRRVWTPLKRRPLPLC